MIAQREFGISVIITTRGRVTLVDELLHSVDKSRTQFKGRSEVIVIDDSSPSDASKIQLLCEKYHASYIFAGPNVTTKRNLGASLAVHPILLFLDSDCVATLNLLSEHAKLYYDNHSGAVLGMVQFVGPSSKLWNAIERTPFVIPFAFPKWMKEVPWGPSANFSVWKENFIKVGGFDETFPAKPGGEDVDLGIRLTEAGYRIRCNPQALVYHSKSTWSSFHQIIKRMIVWGRAEAYLMERHMEKNVITIPKIPFVLFLIGLAVVGSAIALRSFSDILLLPASYAAMISIQAFLQVFLIRRQPLSWSEEFLSILLLNVYEWGITWQLLRRRNLHLVTKQFISVPGQYDGELRFGTIKVISILLTTWLLVWIKILV
jgi:GT2 family glycosyltransferase